MLASCATPLQQCVSQATSNYNAVLAAISVAQGNVARGYAVNTQTVPYQFTGTCYAAYIGAYACPQTSYRTQETPVAINVAEERSKINQYTALLPNLQKQANAATQQCQRQYPEG